MANLGGWGDEGGERLFQRRGVFYVVGGGGGFFAEDLAVEAGEDFAWAYFDVVGDALGGEEVDALDPADGAGDLADEAVAAVGVAGDEAGVDVDGDRDGGVVEGDGFEFRGEGGLGGGHQGAVEGGGDLQHDGALGSGLLAEVGGLFDGEEGSGDDGLVGGVEVGGGDDDGVGGELLGARVGAVAAGQRGHVVGDLGADVVDDRRS